MNILDLKMDIKITEVSSDFFAKEYFAARPISERLINKRLDDANLNVMQAWTVALREYVTNYYDGYLAHQLKTPDVCQK